MVDESLAHEIWYCIRANEVSFFIIEGLRNFLLSFFLRNIALNASDSCDRLHFKQISGYYGLIAFLRVYFIRYNLRPATRRSSHIDNLKPGPK